MPNSTSHSTIVRPPHTCLGQWQAGWTTGSIAPGDRDTLLDYEQKIEEGKKAVDTVSGTEAAVSLIKALESLVGEQNTFIDELDEKYNKNCMAYGCYGLSASEAEGEGDHSNQKDSPGWEVNTGTSGHDTMVKQPGLLSVMSAARAANQNQQPLFPAPAWSQTSDQGGK